VVGIVFGIGDVRDCSGCSGISCVLVEDPAVGRGNRKVDAGERQGDDRTCGHVAFTHHGDEMPWPVQMALVRVKGIEGPKDS
jgi:hypothetical protein